ncbi:MAG: MATE family efflux transporter [Bacteroidales bacterium]|nr:MATE family efflux transporter [Bacteroidales bacterium]
MEKKYYTSTEERIATGKLGPLVMRYALPGAVGLVFVSLQTIVDGIIVGNYLGADALASISIVIPSYTLLTAMALILGIGTQAQMSIGTGQRDYKKTKNAFKTGLYSIVVFAVVFSVFINIFPLQVVRLLGAEGPLVDYSLAYIKGVMPFAVATACFYFFDYMLKTLGHPRFAMIVLVSSILLNVVLSIFFVTYFNWGTFGVGLATGLCSLVGATVSGIVVYRQIRNNTELSKQKGKFEWKQLVRIFYNGSSEGVSEIAMGVTMLLFNLTLMEYVGRAGVAAFSVINYIIFIGTSIFLGISDGTIPIVSYNYGAKLWERIKGIVKIVLRTNFLFGIFFFLLLWFFGEPIISLFLDNETGGEVISLAVNGSKIMGLAFLLNGFNIYTASFFTSIDNAKLSLIVAASRGLIFIIAGLSLLPQIFGINGIWMTIPVAELMTAFISLILWKREFRKRK